MNDYIDHSEGGKYYCDIHEDFREKINTGKHINIILPTLERYNSLIQTIGSIKQSKHRDFTITVVLDGHHSMLHDLKTRRDICLILNKKRMGWVWSMNYVLKHTDDDYYFYGSDDLGFKPNTLSAAMEAMRLHYPDGDGVIGINQNLRHFCPGAFGLMGRKFVNRFPNRAVFFPGYKHFCGDSELWHYAESEGRFYFCKAALVEHRRFQDKTHQIAQSTLTEDRRIWWQKKGKPSLYWGNNFRTRW